MTDYRALCAELIENLEIHCEIDVYSLKLINRARAALAAEVDNPTDEHILRLAREWNSGYESIEFEFISDFARAVLARWGQS